VFAIGDLVIRRAEVPHDQQAGNSSAPGRPSTWRSSDWPRRLLGEVDAAALPPNYACRTPRKHEPGGQDDR